MIPSIRLLSLSLKDMAAKRPRNSGEPADTQSCAKKAKNDTPKSDETAAIQTEMRKIARVSCESTPKEMSHESWGEKLTSFYPAAVVEAVVAFKAGVGSASTPVISAESSSSVYVVTCLIPGGGDIEAIQQYATVDQANKRAMAEFADKCRFLVEVNDENWKRGLGWPGKPYSAIWDLDPNGYWIAVGQSESAKDCATISVAQEIIEAPATHGWHGCGSQGETRRSDRLSLASMNGQEL